MDAGRWRAGQGDQVVEGVILANWWQAIGLARQFQVFETEVGVKYKYGRYDSDRFREYVLGEEAVLPEEWSFADLLLPPDLLRDPFTHCGKSILESPHYALIAEIDAGKLSADSDYMVRSRKGTLDARLPRKLNLRSVRETYALRKEELRRSKMAAVSVFKVAQYDDSKYIIADGKHRAALVAYLNQPELLHLRLISPHFAREPFFQSVYSYTLKMAGDHYAINQKMIRAIMDES